MTMSAPIAIATSAGVLEYAISSSEIARSILSHWLLDILIHWNDVLLGIVKLSSLQHAIRAFIRSSGTDP